MSRIYLDHNATTYLMPEAKEIMLTYMDLPYNPSALHAFGSKAFAIVENARNQILSAFGLNDSWNVVFTASGSEANNIAMRCTTYDQCIISAMEHKSISNAAPKHATTIGVNKDGIVSIEELRNKLSSGNTTLISIMGANNETGCIQPIREISQILDGHKTILHSDMSQFIGKIALDPIDMQLDMFTIAGHKIGAPQGSAALVFRRGIKLSPIIHGGGQEHNIRSGAPNVGAIAALGFVLANKLDFLLDKMQKLAKMHTHMELEMQLHNQSIVIFGNKVPRTPNISYIATPGIDRKKQVVMMDMMGICIGTGSSCSSGGDEPSRTLTAMGVEPELSNCAIRITTGWPTSQHDIEAFITKWKAIIPQLGII